MSFDFSKLLSVAWGGWTTTWPTELLALIWLAFLASWVGASFWQGRTKKQVMTRESQRYSLPILIGGILYTPFIAEILGWKPLWVLGNTGITIAALLSVAGIAFAWWGRLHLGKFWSNTITHKEDHRVIDTGPYGIVRHPIYTGLIFGMLVTGFAIGLVTTILGAILISLGMWQKGRMEEVFLSKELGEDAYGAYCRRVPMIIPFTSPQ
ncbi:methyltransferase family protein [Bradyrhizobium guangdongense]|uniref:Isoprenylcysteine carboxylmethyltransferase family protein n=1 Tax=Bradyrhizobium guangdongense TaxID=1325090 RepID=A0A410V2Y1_9BRAD|nr:isoprenylcysteine carboxylmethyltransferase family protein [Bradyrhizobium guangdongense]QAU38044.1 isoprenylcysteine carboxylmethyltransferase family protein [Bradyrhizobium guangdongense]QOZ59099.1 isoprenylcysteine carboxylmethyltransferase family protein [Bradyrhizobium guangdongense]GGI18993.1 protein-S-isoprenylcysteine methyltransferase [Bradyrhizobium guangdongense]